MRIALFGGTFDPIHHGHLAIASAAADAFALDQIVFAPTGRQPLKSEPPIASFADRLAMVALACTPDQVKPALVPPVQSPDPRFLVSSLDAPHPDGSPNFTVDLLSELCRTTPAAELYVLTGADSFLNLRRWRSPDQLLRLAEWIVVSRPGSSLLEDELTPLALTPAQRARIHLLTTVHQDVSATDLRRRLHAGDPCPGLLPPAVAAYIQSHHLYR